MKPKILLQTDLFTEDEHTDTQEIISHYFDIKKVGDDWPIRYDDVKRELDGGGYSSGVNLYPSSIDFIKPKAVRVCLGLARRLYGDKHFEYANALKWAPYFRDELVNFDYKITDLQDMIKYRESYPISYPKFIRPVSPFKEFSGNVYTKKEFQKEYDFYINNRNGDKFLICLISQYIKIDKEWRCIFINNEYVSGSQYMVNGELNLSPIVPPDVIKKAKELAADAYFQNIFDFVLDIGEVDGIMKLIEVNAFETASFYAADLDKIYRTLSQQY